MKEKLTQADGNIFEKWIIKGGIARLCKVLREKVDRP